jgi:hypothetical protein
VLMHNSSNAGEAMGVESVAEDDIRCSLPLTVKWDTTPHGRNEIRAYGRGVKTRL